MKHGQKSLKPFFVEFLIIAAVSLVLTEISLRLYNYYNPTFIFYTDSYNRFRGKAFADDWNFKLNSHGFKDKEFPEKKENTYRIIGIGDSFAFGAVPYEHNYLTLLESELQSEYPRVEVLNMGIPGIGPKEYLSFLLKEGLSFQPDLVLLSFFTGNDFNDSQTGVFERSYLLSLLNYFVNIRSKYEGMVIHGKNEYCDTCPAFDSEEYLAVEYARSRIYLTDNNKFSGQLDDAAHYLRQIKKICEQKGIGLVVVIIPDELQINLELQEEVKARYGRELAKGGWDTVQPNHALAKKLNELGIDYIDLHRNFAEAPAQPQLYRLRDSHWNIAGNLLAAGLIQARLRKYLPPALP